MGCSLDSRESERFPPFQSYQSNGVVKKNKLKYDWLWGEMMEDGRYKIGMQQYTDTKTSLGRMELTVCERALQILERKNQFKNFRSQSHS